MFAYLPGQGPLPGPCSLLIDGGAQGFLEHCSFCPQMQNTYVSQLAGEAVPANQLLPGEKEPLHFFVNATQLEKLS